MTGWAQVRYRYANNLEEEIEKLRYDLYYVKHASIALDLRILLETCGVLIAGRLSDGVDRPRAQVAVESPKKRFRSPSKLKPTGAA